MLKRMLIIIVLLLAIHQTYAGVTIQEVLYNPIKTENGGEAVLLYNTDINAVDVSNWVIATGVSSSDATIPPQTFIYGEGYLLIADSGFSLNKDDPSWPDADFEEAITLPNSNSGVALMNGSEIIDAVGWGNSSMIESSLFEGTPHPGAQEGFSLKRTEDTENNSQDFTVGIPVFYSQSTGEQDGSAEATIDVQINVTSQCEGRLNLSIQADDDISEPGVQINPVADEKRVFQVVATLDGENSTNQTGKVVIEKREFALLKEGLVFVSNISMDYFDEAKTYSLSAQIESDCGIMAEKTEFEYTKLAAISTDKLIGFELAAGNSTKRKIVIRNTGNKDVNISIKGTDIIAGESRIEVQNICYLSTLGAVALSEEYQSTGKVLERSGSLELEISINASKNSKPGSYNGKIMISGE